MLIVNLSNRKEIFMDQKEIYAQIINLWSESVLEAQTKCLPETIVFADKITKMETERCCKIVCLLCNQGHKIKQVGSRWRHVITSESGYEHKEWCRAENIRGRGF